MTDPTVLEDEESLIDADEMEKLWDLEDDDTLVWDGEEVLETTRSDRNLLRYLKEEAENLQGMEKRGVDILPTFKGLFQDLFSVLYKIKPTMKDYVPDALHVNRRVMEDLRTTAEYRKLRPYTRNDDVASAMAMLAMEEYLKKAIPEKAKEEQEQAQEAGDSVKGLRNKMKQWKQLSERRDLTPDEIKQIEKLKKELIDQQRKMKDIAKRQQQTVGKKGPLIRGQLRKALKKAMKDAKEIAEAQAALGWGVGAGAGGADSDPRERIEIAKLLRRADRLRKAAKLIGRMRGLAFQKQASKLHGASSVVSVKPGRNLSRLLPSELVKLCDPDLEQVFMRDFCSGKLLEYKLKGNLKQIMGPMVACLDVSGSMWGERADWAMALVLSALWVCQRQKRPFYLVVFDHGIQAEFEMTDWGTREIIEWSMKNFGGGGTEFSIPLKRAIEIIDKDKKFTKADILMITDGECDIHENDRREISNYIESRGVFLFTFYIFSGHYWRQSGQALEDLSHKKYDIKDFDEVDAAGDFFGAI